jgi:hypothetical protein
MEINWRCRTAFSLCGNGGSWLLLNKKVAFGKCRMMIPQSTKDDIRQIADD